MNCRAHRKGALVMTALQAVGGGASWEVFAAGDIRAVHPIASTAQDGAHVSIPAAGSQTVSFGGRCGSSTSVTRLRSQPLLR